MLLKPMVLSKNLAVNRDKVYPQRNSCTLTRLAALLRARPNSNQVGYEIFPVVPPRSGEPMPLA